MFDDEFLSYNFLENKIHIFRKKKHKKIVFNCTFSTIYKKQIEFFINIFSKKKYSYSYDISDLKSTLILSKLLFKLRKSNKLNKTLSFS